MKKREEKIPFWWPPGVMIWVVLGYVLAGMALLAFGTVGMLLYGFYLLAGFFMAITRRQYHLRQQLDRIEALLEKQVQEPGQGDMVR